MLTFVCRYLDYVFNHAPIHLFIINVFFCLLYCKTGYLVKTIHLTVDIFENFHSSRLLSIVTFPNEFKWIAWYSKVFRGHCKMQTQVYVSHTGVCGKVRGEVPCEISLLVLTNDFSLYISKFLPSRCINTLTCKYHFKLCVQTIEHAISLIQILPRFLNRFWEQTGIYKR